MTWLIGQSVKEQIRDGKKGFNKGYKTAFEDFKLYQGRIFVQLGGTGSGKSQAVTASFGFEPLQDFIDNYSKDPNRVYHWFLYSMEMDREEIALRLAAYVYATRLNRQLPPTIISGMESGLKTIDQEWIEENAVPLLDKFSEWITIQGKSSVAQMHKDVTEFYKPHGEIVTENNREYFKTDKHITCLCTVDHVALVKGEGSKKNRIDELAGWEMDMKLMYKTTFMNVQQLNRSEGDLNKLKHMSNPAPTLAEAKDSGDLIDAADYVIAWFNPHRFGISRYFEYQIEGYEGLEDRARFLFTLKGRNIEAGTVLATAFYGESGVFVFGLLFLA